MVYGQLETNGITEKKLLDAYRQTPREMFVGDGQALKAYIDSDIVFAGNRYALEPRVEARLLQLAIYGGEAWGELEAENVLYLGANALGGLAVLASLTKKVHLLEPDKNILQQAMGSFERAGIHNISAHVGETIHGLEDEAPFDAIILPGAASYIPDILLDQLAINGRFVCVLRPRSFEPGRLICITRLEETHYMSQDIMDAATIYAPEFTPQPEFFF